MKFIHSLALVLAVAAFSAPTWAAQPDQHTGHHPANKSSATPTAKPPGKANPEMARMDTQLKAMGDMHDKMMAAKTPEERNALMAEHMKTMQEGMTMMNGMSPGGMKGRTQRDMNAHDQMMEKRMEMMHSMMQMMMDRMAAAPAKS